MPVLSSLDPVAAIAQIAGLDAHGLIALIVRLAETVRRNRYDCGQLAQQVEAIGGLLRQVQLEHPAMDGALGKLEATLREACVLVSACQGAGYLRRILRSGRHAEQFRRVRNRIEFYLQLFPVIGHIDTTRRLIRILNGIQPPQTQTQNVPPSSPTRTGSDHRFSLVPPLYMRTKQKPGWNLYHLRRSYIAPACLMQASSCSGGSLL